MIIKLQAQIRPDTLTLVKEGDVLTLNGEVFDFSPLTNGSTLPIGSIDSQWFLGKVDRDDGGVITIGLLYPVLDFDTHAQVYPDDLIDVQDGVVEFPKADPKPEPEEVETVEFVSDEVVEDE